MRGKTARVNGVADRRLKEPTHANDLDRAIAVQLALHCTVLFTVYNAHYKEHR